MPLERGMLRAFLNLLFIAPWILLEIWTKDLWKFTSWLDMEQKLYKILLTPEQTFCEALAKMIQSFANIRKRILGPFRWVGIPRWLLGF